MTTLNRRSFLAASLAAAPGMAALARDTQAQPAAASAKNGPCVCVFSKHLQFLDYKELAATCKALGLDGVDLTVRDGGHVRPERVAEDLPRAVEALRAQGLEVPMITTRLNSGDDPDAWPILETASKLGIRYFRVGGHKYDEQGGIREQIDRFAGEMRGLIELAAECDMTAGYHNHSGMRRVGAPLWDLYHMIQAVDSKHFGSNFDVGHATVEGAYGGWEINTRLMAPHVKMMAVKDFVWRDDRPQWVRLGNGIVETADMLGIIFAAGFQGPISIHIEYPTLGDDRMIREVGKSVEILRACIEQATA